MPIDEKKSAEMLAKVEDRYHRLEQSKRLGPPTAVVSRFVEIDGATQGGLVAVELFTTIIPLIVIGFSYLSGFAENVSPGVIFQRDLHLSGPLAELFQAAFGTSSGLKSTWTVMGVFGFLIWGVPMSITIAGMFAKAWRREQFSLLGRLRRGSLWFVLYLVTIALRDRITFGGEHGTLVRVMLFTAALIPCWVFWSLTPRILVRDGGRGQKYLLLAGLAGVVIDGIIIPLAGRVVFPKLLAGWVGFGPIGVSMALMTWCGVIGIGWVVTACVSAVLWERNAPETTVIEAQLADDL